MILIVTQTFAPATGGMEAYMTGLATHLTQSGKKVTVLADMTTKRDAPFSPGAAYHLIDVGGPRPWRRWRKRRIVAKLAATHRIDGIFCDSWKSVESLPSDMSAPLIVLAHGAEFPPATAPAKRRRIGGALSRATRIFANSRFTCDCLRPYLTADAPHPDIVPPPTEKLAHPTQNARDKIAKARDGNTPVIGVIARLEPRKGIDRVILALAALKEKHPRAAFLIGGDGADKKRLEDLARTHAVANRVVFLNRIGREEKTALLESCDLFAMPVRREGKSVEGFGISYIEAALAGVPAIGGAGSGASDAIVDGETGLLCDGVYQDSVTAALDRLLSDKELRHRLGQAAKDRATRDLTWDALLPRFLNALTLTTDSAA